MPTSPVALLYPNSAWKQPISQGVKEELHGPRWKGCLGNKKGQRCLYPLHTQHHRAFVSKVTHSCFSFSICPSLFKMVWFEKSTFICLHVIGNSQFLCALLHKARGHKAHFLPDTTVLNICGGNSEFTFIRGKARLALFPGCGNGALLQWSCWKH